MAARGPEERGLAPARAAALRAALRDRFPLVEVEGTGGVRLHLAGPRSGLSRLVGEGGAPYWAQAWPGGLALARHLAAWPEVVRGREVVDLGAGSGLAGIGAARAGAARVMGIEADPLAVVAAGVNAAANGVVLEVRLVAPAAAGAALAEAAEEGAVVLAGDVFYGADAAKRMTRALDGLGGRALALVGDIGRAHLPRDRLERVASYPVRDVGDPPGAAPREGGVFLWR